MNWNIGTRIVIEKSHLKNGFVAELRDYRLSFEWKVLASNVGITPQEALKNLTESEKYAQVWET